MGRLRRRRGDDGFSLVEVLVTIAILGAVMVPLLLWVTQVIDRSQDSTATDANAFTQVNRFLKRDVPSSTRVSFPTDPSDPSATFESCADLTGAAVAGDVQLALQRQEPDVGQVEYRTVAQGDVTSLVRVECVLVGSVWQIEDTTELAEELGTLGSGDQVDISCGDGEADAAGRIPYCAVVSVSLAGASGPPVTITQVRRTEPLAAASETESELPIARITTEPSPPTGVRPLSVAFSAVDSVNPGGGQLDYAWDLDGDVSTTESTSSTPTFTYDPDFVAPSQSRTYRVTLAVTNSKGTARATIEVQVRNARPTALITIGSDPVYREVPVEFSAAGSQDPDGVDRKPAAYIWEVKRSDETDWTQISDQETFSYAFTDVSFASGQTSRTYNVRLTVVDADGARVSTTEDVPVLNNPPIAAINPPIVTLPDFGRSQTFSANPITPCPLVLVEEVPSGSCDRDGTITSYSWNFGNGTVRTGPGPHIVDFSGLDAQGNPTVRSYTVTLVVTDDDGEQTTVTAPVTINKGPRAVIASSSATAPASIFSRAGNGSIVVNGPTVDGTTTPNATVNFEALSPAGVYSQCPDPLPATLTSSCDFDGTLTEYAWILNGGTPVVNPGSYTLPFTAAGTYNLALRVTDNDTATDTASISVKINRAPTASFSTSLANVERRKEVTFNSTSSDTDGPAPTNCTWSVFIGSNPAPVTTLTGCTNVRWTPQQLTTADGARLQLDVVDSEGGVARTSQTFTIKNQPPVVSVIPVPRVLPDASYAVQDGETLQIGCNNSIDPDVDNPSMTCTWSWGDGTTTTVPFGDNAFKTYTRQASCLLPGSNKCTYRISLVVTDADHATFGNGRTTWGSQSCTVGSAGCYTVKVNRPPTATLAFVSPSNGQLAAPNDGSNFRFVVQATASDIDGFAKGVTYICEEKDANGVWVQTSIGGQYVDNPAPTTENRVWNSTNGLGQGVCVYSNRGEKRVRLEVFDNDLTFASRASLPAVTGRVNIAPIAKGRITSPTTVDLNGNLVSYSVGTPITFENDGSSDPDGNSSLLTYRWVWNNANGPTVYTGAGPLTMPGFSNPGPKTLTLTVTDSEGTVSAPFVLNIRVNRPPEARFTRTAPSGSCPGLVPPSYTQVCRGVPVVYDATGSSDLNDSPLVSGSPIAAYEWTVPEDDGSIATITTPTFTRTYLNLSGTRVASLRVRDTDGIWSTPVSVSFAVVDAAPIATFTTSPSPATKIWGGSGDTFPVGFDATGSFDPDGAPPGGSTLTYAWDFGDGTTLAAAAAGANTAVNHTYTQPGRYTVTLTVRDRNGVGTPPVTSTRTVLFNQRPVAAIAPVPITNSTTVALDGSPSVDPAPEGNTSTLTYAWTLTRQDGTGSPVTATGRTPTVNLPTRGVWVATLVVTDADGAVSTPATTPVQVNVGPTACIGIGCPSTPDPARIVLNAPYSYDFLGAGSSDDEGAANLTYAWDFGDGSPIQTGDAVSKTFAAPTVNTTRTVRLTVTDRFGVANTFTMQVKLNRPPTAVVGPPTIVAERGFPTSFDGTGSSDPDPDTPPGTLTYAWNFGDPASGASNVSTAAQPTHTFTNAGNYTVSLTVTDADGGVSSTVTRVVNVVNRAPVASFTTNPSGNPVYREYASGQTFPVAFDATGSTDPYNVGLQYQWNFGDGSPVIAFGTQATPNHTFTAPGRFTVTLTVRDPNTGLTSTATRDVVFNAPPVAVVTPPDTYRSGVPTTVNFTGSGSSDPAPDNGPLTYAWNFGDPNSTTDTSTATNPSYTYTAAGQFLVTLTVTDKYGAQSTAFATVRVNTRPTAVIAGPPIRVLNPPYSTTFDGSGSTDDAGAANLTYSWDFGDGTTETGSVVNKSYDAALAGTTVTVTLSVTDQFGEVSTATQQVKINQRPLAVIGPDPIRAKQGFVTQFNSNGSSDPDGNSANLTYQWNFGDPASGAANTSTQQSPGHLYNQTGTYTVSLTVTDQDGLASTTVTEQVTVTVNQAPTAAITALNLPVWRNVPEPFSGSPSVDPDGTISAWNWTFPGPVARTGENISYTFTQNGPATVSLQVLDDNGVASAPVQVNFTVVPKDVDGDGFEDKDTGGNDCNDNDPAVNPSANDPLDPARADTNCDGVDSVVSESIFVAATGTLALGDPNAGGCGLPQTPCLNIGDGISQARDFGRRNVLVAGGAYTRFSLSEGDLTIRGGYASDFRPGGTGTTTVNGSADFFGVLSAASFTNLTGPVTVRDMTFRGADATGQGQATYGIIVRTGGENLTLQDVTIIGGRGGPGRPGNPGANATQNAAGPGQPGENSRRISGGSCNESRSLGGSGATGAGRGGDGGQADGGCPFSTSATGGLSGGAGTPVGGGNCGIGGPGGGGSSGNGGNGGDGNVGCNGSAGAAGGSGASGSGTISGGLWVPPSAAAGGNGALGGSGGGGGAGGGGGGTDNCSGFLCLNNGPDSRGAGGGGGGQGGVTATSGGGGGGAGGASIAVFLNGTRPTFANVTITMGNGGTGGTGGNGAQGQPGGTGGNGGLGRCDSSAPAVGPCNTVGDSGGGAGGRGGNGGRGGPSGAGGGGAGGPSFGILATGAGAVPSATISGGNGGAGGAGGAAASGGNAGPAGAAGPRATQAVL